jgi:FtsP/CotA-like multicopper oxidase with cupredoxin domain
MGHFPAAGETEPSTGGRIARRRFLGVLGAGGGAAAIAASLGFRSGDAKDETSAGQKAGMAHPATAHRAAAAAPPSADGMDAHHRAGVEAFERNRLAPITAGTGALDAPFRKEGGRRVFELTAERTSWEVTPGQRVEALAFNGMVPGPTLRMVEGEPARVVVHNRLDQSTSVHWHGQRVPNAMDGVTYLTQEPIRPGETFVYDFTPGPFGTHMYHSHHNSTEQVTKGLAGALLVQPAETAVEPGADRDYLFILNDGLGGFTVNGKGFPATPAYTARRGERVRFRFLNYGAMAHPVHLHGLTYEVFARDGYPLPQPFRCDTLTIAPFERWDAIVLADNPGTWAFHCHILSHAEGPAGMFGMFSALHVD